MYVEGLFCSGNCYGLAYLPIYLSGFTATFFCGGYSGRESHDTHQ